MKTVLITGGTRGIGKAIVTAFQKKGYRVAVTYSKDDKSATEAKQAGLEVYRADVRDENAITELFKKLGAVDILINNAGVSLVKQIQDTTKEEWDDLFAVNVTGAFLCAREAAKTMISNQSGLIINISSIWGEVGGSCEVAYSASKGALIAFTKALAKELAPSKIRVNCISPGAIQTQMNACFSKDEIQALEEEIHIGRMGFPEEVASAALFLEENEYVTGIDLAVNGGFCL
ncbi:MAG: SDR family oxidoreductase [Clostridia bacterium]|nr:SDR family oxidoreductase [Clostridia bacterium]